jgi:hypothetical protein
MWESENDGFNLNNGDNNSFNIDIDEYIHTFINHSESDVYVLISYNDEGSLIVADRGSMDYCVDRLKCLFDLSVKGSLISKYGMSIVSIEEFYEMVDCDDE